MAALLLRLEKHALHANRPDDVHGNRREFPLQSRDSRLVEKPLRGKLINDAILIHLITYCLID